MADLFAYALVPIALLAVAAVLGLGLWNLMKGGDPNRSQKLMQLRVLLQFLAIIVAMGALWFLGR